MKLFLSLTLLLTFSTSLFADIENIEISNDINEISPVSVKEIKQLLETMPKENTCMDEYLKRRNQLILKVVASPIMMSAYVVAGVYAGAGSAVLVMQAFPTNSVWAAMGHMILGGLAGGAITTVFGIVDTSKAGIELNQVNTILKTLGEYYLNREGIKTEKMYSKFMSKNAELNITKAEYVNELIELDQSGALCDGSLVVKPRIRLGSKLKYKVAKTKSINKTIANNLILD